MTSTARTKTGGVLIKFDRPECVGVVEFDGGGKVIRSECRVKPEPLPPQRMPEGFDPAQEARRMKQGGCCGQASE